MTLEQFVEQYKEVPLTGTFLRRDFNKFTFGGISFQPPGVHCVVASLNYLCLDPYSETQRVKVDGICLSVYVDRHRTERVVARNLSEIESLIVEAAQKANSLCDHAYGRELSVEECREKGVTHFGNCYHVYQCSKCNEIFGVDSSG